MNVLFITGSARPEAWTTELCKVVANTIYDANPVFINPYEMDIKHCTGCRKCREGKCAIDDDMPVILNAVDKCDIIIFATPLYWSAPSSIIKQVVDRFQSIWETHRFKNTNKVVGLICIGGQPHPQFAGVPPVFKVVAMAIGATWAGDLLLGGTDGLKEIPMQFIDEAKNFANMIEKAYKRF